MRRRDLLLLAAATAAIRNPASAETKAPRIGFVRVGSRQDNQGLLDAFRENLAALGWSDGSDITIAERWAEERAEQLPGIVKELIGSGAAILVTAGTPATLAAKRASATIPIVLVGVDDPVALGVVASLAQPGGNITGFSLGEFSLGGKILEVLKEMVPQLSRVAVVLNIEQPPHVAMWSTSRATAASIGVRLTAMDVQGPAEIERGIDDFSREPNGGLIVLPGPATGAHRELIIALAARHHLPAAYAYPSYVKAGGLMSYGVDPSDQPLQAAAYIDRILKGAQPGDLPIQQPTKYRLVINLKTAKALGLVIPESFLLRADEVVE